MGQDASEVDDLTGDGVFYRNSKTRIADIHDGTSNTVMIGDRAWAQTNGSWASDAHWMEADPNLVTGYALMTLSYCRPKASRDR